ncbi:CatB-related O-acetyltransferase [Megalodesulfovibrio gigas]|nr:CatB-related O-acetyltransferase [Megalodesulfovibrio gigas]
MKWHTNGPPAGYRTLPTACGEPAFAHESVRMLGEVTLGRFSYVNQDSLLAGFLPIRIGAFTCIGPRFYAHTRENHRITIPSAYPFQLILGMDLPFPYTRDPRGDGINIGSDVWIGSHVKVAEGVCIGHGAVVGTYSLVTRDVEPYGIYVGVPARLLRFRFSESVIADLLDIAWWQWPLERILQNVKFFSTDLQKVKTSIKNLIE